MLHRFAYATLLILVLAIMPTPLRADPLPPRHMTFELFERTMTGEVIPIGEESAEDIACTTYKRTSPTSWQGVPAPVVYLNGRWYVSILSSYDDMLYCTSGITDYAPAWIEDHDPGLPGSGDVLIMDMALVRTFELNKDKLGLWQPIAVEACGLVPHTIEQFCTVLPILSEVFGYGDGGPRAAWLVNVPGWVARWAVTSWRYNGPVR